MTPAPPQAPPVPPACAECITTLQQAQGGAAVQQTPSKILRAADGKIRVDSGNISTITDPNAQKSILLDHVKKEFRVIQVPQAPQMPQPPQFAMPTPPQAPPLDIKDLGQKLIDGHPVEGKQFTFAPPPPPGVPSNPPLPQPNVPNTVAEVWTSTLTKLPVLTKIKGGFGEQICKCTHIPTGEPAPAAFQIPPEYKPAPIDPPKIELPKVEPPKIEKPKFP